MRNIQEILKDFNAVAGGYRPVAERIAEEDFIARLVICYTEEQKAKDSESYRAINDYAQLLNDIQFTNKRKENKYFYLLHKSDFKTKEEFEIVKKAVQNDNDSKILTINTKNFNLPKVQAFLKLVSEVLSNK